MATDKSKGDKDPKTDPKAGKAGYRHIDPKTGKVTGYIPSKPAKGK